MSRNVCKFLSITICFYLISVVGLVAEETNKIRRITVTGDGVDKVPGSAHLLKGEALEEVQQGFSDIHRVLRSVPGVNIQEEEGYGLRPNIGFRGTSVERSANITLMEDSVLIAPAPYAAPSAYYFPTTGRMEGIEILKGASQVKYGPRTVGGSLNLFSTSIPDEFRLHADVRAGQDDTKIGHFHFGDSYKYGGWNLETYQAESDGFKKLDSGGDTGFDLQDYVGKFRVNTDPDKPFYQELELKLGTYEQDSNDTYLGLTEDDFNRNPFRRYAGSQLDNIQVDHTQYQLTHYLEIADDWDLTTVFYRNNTDRNWFKLEKVNGSSVASILRDTERFADELAWIRGADSPEGSFAIRNNRRDYYSEGIQTVLGHEFIAGETEHNLEFGMRYHQDEEDRFQEEDLFQMVNGRLVQNGFGDPGSNANRIGEAEAWAFYLQDEIQYGALTLTPGVRFESIHLTRTDFGKEDPNRTGVDLQRNSTNINVTVPGVGAHYQLTNSTAIFGGLHKGFSPPGPSKDDSVSEEESINYEAGVNYTEGSLWSELVLFYNDYENLLGADTVSSGGEGTGDLFNGGESTVFGLEASAYYDLNDIIESSFRVPFKVSYTYTSAEFDTSFDSDFFGLVSDGDDIPYIPQHQLSTGLGVGKDKWELSLNGHYVDAMATIAGQAGLVSTDRTDSYFVFDLNGEYEVRDGAYIYASVQNLFDEEYVVARRPAGARPGLPQSVFVGFKVTL